MAFLFNHTEMLKEMIQMAFDRFKSFVVSVLPPPYAKFGRGLDSLEHDILQKDMRLIDTGCMSFFCLENFKLIQAMYKQL